MVCVCVSTLILATRRPISDTSGFRTTRAWKLKGRFSWNDCIRDIIMLWKQAKSAEWRWVSVDTRDTEDSLLQRALAHRDGQFITSSGTVLDNNLNTRWPSSAWKDSSASCKERFSTQFSEPYRYSSIQLSTVLHDDKGNHSHQLAVSRMTFSSPRVCTWLLFIFHFHTKWHRLTWCNYVNIVVMESIRVESGDVGSSEDWPLDTVLCDDGHPDHTTWATISGYCQCQAWHRETVDNGRYKHNTSRFGLSIYRWLECSFHG